MAAAFCCFLLGNCKVPYDPPLKPGQIHSLVVEGFIDGSDTVNIKLSRTRMVSAGDTADALPELNATVLIEDDQNSQYPLFSTGGGNYGSNGILNLDPSKKYRLRIQTAGGKEYASDFVPYKPVPEIDNIGWKFKDDGVMVYVNTHDPGEATKYYRWEYQETWEFHSTYNTGLVYIPAINLVVDRTDQVFICWRSNNFSTILLGSTAKLTHDVIEQAPIIFIPEHSQKLSVLYSILVRQIPLDINAYNYWVAMRNNTEKVGSIFDPQPNHTVGNIHCITNPSEIVVGYISAGSTTKKRFFIKNSELTSNWNISQACETRDVTEDSTAYYFTAGYAPLSESLTPTGAKLYNASYIECIDCTLFGSNVKPDFWP
jgi:hypothetical protein